MTKEEATEVLIKMRSCIIDNAQEDALDLAIDALSKHSLPSNLDEAAREKAREIFNSHEKYNIGEEKNRILLGLLELETFAMMFYDKGAEWQAKQGYSLEYIIQYALGVSDTSTESKKATLSFPLPADIFEGDKVIVQIRKIDYYKNEDEA